MGDHVFLTPNDAGFLLHDISNRIDVGSKKRKRAAQKKERKQRKMSNMAQKTSNNFASWNSAPISVRGLEDENSSTAHLQASKSPETVGHDHGYAMSSETEEFGGSEDNVSKSSHINFSGGSCEEVMSPMMTVHEAGVYECRTCTTKFPNAMALDQYQCSSISCMMCKHVIHSPAFLDQHLHEVHNSFLCDCGFLGLLSEVSFHTCACKPPSRKTAKRVPAASKSAKKPKDSSTSLPMMQCYHVTDLSRTKMHCSGGTLEASSDMLPNEVLCPRFKEPRDPVLGADQDGVDEVNVCPLCGYVSFNYATHMKHYLTHKLTNHRSIEAVLYTCEICSFVCQGINSARDHILGHSEDSSPSNPSMFFTCRDCTFVTDSIVQYEEHSLGHIHKEQKKIGCTLCLWTSDSYFANQIHLLSHDMEEGINTQETSENNDEPSKPENVENADHSQDRPPESGSLSCKRCKFTCDSRKDFLSHIKKHMSTMVAEAGVFKCSTCRYVTLEKLLLQKHEYTHLGYNTMYTCLTCYYFSPDKKEYYDHRCPSKNKIPTEFTCLECGFTVTNQEARYNKHKHAMTRLECNKCEFWCHELKVFNDHSALCPGTSEQNSFSSEGVKKKPNSKKGKANQQVNSKNGGIIFYNCFLCDFRCTTKSDVKEHSLSHTGLSKVLFYIDDGPTRSNSKVFYCSFCNFSTQILSDLKKHVFSHVNLQDDMANNDAQSDEDCMMVCGKCDFVTSDFEALKTHEMAHDSDHPLEQESVKRTKETMIYSCRICSYSSEDAKDMNRHSEAHLKEIKKKKKPDKRKKASNNRDFSTMDPILLDTNEEEHEAQTNDQATHNPEKQSIYNCSLCSYTSQDFQDIRRHTLAHVNGSTRDPENCQLSVATVCGVCSFSTRNLQEWIDHEKVHQANHHQPTTKENSSKEELPKIRPVKLANLLEPSIAKALSTPVGNQLDSLVPPNIAMVPSSGNQLNSLAPPNDEMLPSSSYQLNSPVPPNNFMLPSSSGATDSFDSISSSSQSNQISSSHHEYQPITLRSMLSSSLPVSSLSQDHYANHHISSISPSTNGPESSYSNALYNPYRPMMLPPVSSNDQNSSKSPNQYYLVSTSFPVVTPTSSLHNSNPVQPAMLPSPSPSFHPKVSSSISNNFPQPISSTRQVPSKSAHQEKNQSKSGSSNTKPVDFKFKCPKCQFTGARSTVLEHLKRSHVI